MVIREENGGLVVNSRSNLCFASGIRIPYLALNSAPFSATLESRFTTLRLGFWLGIVVWNKSLLYTLLIGAVLPRINTWAWVRKIWINCTKLYKFLKLNSQCFPSLTYTLKVFSRCLEWTSPLQRGWVIKNL